MTSLIPGRNFRATIWFPHMSSSVRIDTESFTKRLATITSGLKVTKKVAKGLLLSFLMVDGRIQ